MKRGKKRLFIFDIIIIIIFLLLNSFVSSILSGYISVALMALLLIIFKLFFGFEKDRHRYSKSICLEIIIFLMIYFILYYLSGLIFTFYKTINYYTLNSIFKILLPLIITIVLREILRYMMLCKAEGSKFNIITICIVFILFDLLNVFNIKSLNSNYTIFMFLAIYLLPSISKNILCSYTSYKTGYKPVILYCLIMELYIYLLPIIPNPNQYISSLLQLIVPFILLYRIYIFFKKEKDEDVIIKKYKHSILVLIPSLLFAFFLAYFTSGYFNYHAIVIGSGSMVPNINKGDVVVIERKIKNYDDIKIGQIMAVKHENIIVVHRLVKKIKSSDEMYYYTKGDANNDIDNFKITKKDIYGIVNTKIPYIGLPTVWLRDL